MHLSGILETALYTEDLPRLSRFYRQVFGLEVLLEEERMHALKLGPEAVLLLFAEGKSVDGAETPRGFIPGHDGRGPLHVCFRIEAGTEEGWRTHLQHHGISIISEVVGMGGGLSLYFHDPDGHVVELAPAKIWKEL